MGGRIVHDLRAPGSAAWCAGHQRDRAIRLSGDKTMSVFRCYDITSTDHFRHAALKLPSAPSA
jgi:hypothetical protein